MPEDALTCRGYFGSPDEARNRIQEEVEDTIRNFLSQVDPASGYME